MHHLHELLLSEMLEKVFEFTGERCCDDLLKVEFQTEQELLRRPRPNFKVLNLFYVIDSIFFCLENTKHCPFSNVYVQPTQSCPAETRLLWRGKPLKNTAK